MATTIIKTIKPFGGDYTSLSAWEAGEQRDLVTANEIAVAECYSMTDTAQVTVSGWTTDATHYLHIYTPVTERHAGKWDGTKYNISPSSGHGIYMAPGSGADYVKIDGLQIRPKSPNYNSALAGIHWGSANGECTVDSCVFWGDLAVWQDPISWGYAFGIEHVWVSGSTYNVIKVSNCIGYEFVDANNATSHNNYSAAFSEGNNQDTSYYENCTSLNNAAGFYGNFTTVWKNCGDSGSAVPFTGGTQTTCSSITPVFVDAVNKDFHLASGDTTWKGAGTDLSADANYPITTDIDGETRTGTWDIGADECLATGGGSILISGIAAGLSSSAGDTGLAYGAAGAVTGLSAMSVSAALSYALTGPLTGLSAFSGSAIRDFSVSGATTGISGVTGLAGLGSGLAGSIAAASFSNAGVAILRVVSGAANILSLVYGDIRTSGLTILSGSTNSLSALNGGVALARSLGGAMAGNTALSASAGVFRAIDGVLSGVSLLSAGITGLAVKSISGHTNVFSTLPGGLVMEYGLGGSSFSGVLLRGDIHEVISCGGSLFGSFFASGTPAFIGPFSPAFRAGAPMVDVTRYGGGGSPTVQADSEMAKVTQDNINPGVTR